MSETNVNVGFDFYLRFAKPLVLNLPEAKDRVLAAAWVQKLRSDACGSEKLRTDYLKLLLFVLQKGRLLGTFLNNPNQYDALDEFPVTTKLHEVAKCWLEAEEIQRRKRILLGIGGGDLPPFTTDCSGDLLEYVAAQDIPNFGVHVYYAISSEPLPRWDNVEAGVFPKGALGSVQKAVSATTTATAPSETDQGDRSRTRSRTRSRSRSRRSESAGRHEEFGEAEGEGVHKIRSPLGSKKPKEERLPPTWGSNLISVGDPPVPEHLFRKEEGGAPGTPAGAPGTPTGAPPSPAAGYPFASSPLEKGRPPPSFTEPTTEAPWDTSAPSLPYKTPPWDMSAPSLPYKTPTATPPSERFPEGEASPLFLESTPEFFDDSQLPYGTPTPEQFPEGAASPFFLESTPEFFDDSELGSPITASSPRKFPLRTEPDIAPIYEPPSFFDEEDEAPSLPYQTPPWDMSAPSIPYQTPPWDMSGPSLPYQTPPWDMSAPSLPYQTPPWDMSGPSLPYQTPPWDMSAPSLPYKTPPQPPRKPLDPFAIAQAQYEDLFDSTPEYVSDVSSADVQTTFESSGLSFPSLPPSPQVRGTPERRVSESPAAQISRIIESGIAPASPAAQEIIDEVMEELSASQPSPDLEELYAEIEQKYPGRRTDMPRTPPILSKYPKIREAGKRITYKPEEFDIPRDVEWQSAPEYLERAPPLSPRVDLREMHRPKPFKELFPTVERKIEEEKFFDIEGDSVIFDDDDLLVQSPRNKLQKRLQEVMGELSKAADEVPAIGGIPVTTPRRTVTPLRSPEIDNDYPIFYEEMPSFESPKLSPRSRLALDAERQYRMLESPETRPEPSPERMRTPEFLRQMQLEEQAKRSPVDEFGLPLVQTLPSPTLPPARRAKPPSPPKEAVPPPEAAQGPEEPAQPLTLEEIMAKAEQQYEELYASLVEEPAGSPPVSPTKRTPTREEAEALGIPPVEKQPSPPPWSPKLSPLKKPPPPRAARPEPAWPERLAPAGPVKFEDVIDFEFPPEEMYDFFPGTPPSPPPQFDYESPVYSPREDLEFLSPPMEYKDVFDRSYSDEMDALSPPMTDILAAHEFTEGFFDPDRPFMTKSVQVGTGTRRRLARYSAPPALADIHESPEQEFPSPEAYQFPTADVSQMGRSPEVLPTLRQPYGPMTQEEQYYVSEFQDPKQQEMLRRVLRIVADVGEPLISARDIRAEVEAELPAYPRTSTEEDLLEGTEPIDFAPSPPAYTTPPKLTYPADADYLDATSPVDLDYSPPAYTTPPRRTRPVAAEEAYGIPEVGFQQPYQEFVSPRTSPRERRPAFSAPSPPEFDFQQPYEEFVSPRASPRTPSRRPPSLSPDICSPCTPTDLLDTSPPFELDSPPEDLPETVERLKAMPFTLPKRKPMFVRQGISGLVPVKYHEPPFFVRDIPVALTFGQEMDVIHEVPETEYDEEHPEFTSKVKTALRIGPTGFKRRMMKEARSRKPKLHTMAEIDEYPVEYPPSPVSARSPVGTPPRLAGPPVTYEGPLLVDVTTPRRVSPRTTPEPAAAPTPRKTRRIKRKTTTRKLDFDTTPPSPEPPKTRPLTPPPDEDFITGLSRQVRELERRHADLPPLPRPVLPEELMGFEGAVGAEIPQTIMDSTPPRRLPEPLQPPVQIPGWKTPPHLIDKKKTPSPFQFKMKPSLRDIIYQEVPPDEFGSPGELDLSSYEPLGTEMGGFLSPVAAPYEFEPSPPRQFGPQERQRIRTPPRRPVSSRARGVDPFAMSAAEYEALYQKPSPERKPDEATRKVLALAQEQYAQLFDSPTEATRLPSPPRKAVATSVPQRLPRAPTVPQRLPREPTVQARPRRVDTGPRTPPKDLFRRQDFDFMVLERPPEDLMPPGSPPSPISYRSALEDMRQTVRRHKYEEPPCKQAFMYGHGVKRPKPIGQRRPGLETVQEQMVEPTDAYEYWPGAYQPQPYQPPPVTRPRPVERAAVSPRPIPPPRAISPPRALSPPRVMSPPRAVSPVQPGDPFGLPERYELKIEDIGIPPGFQLPTDLSPVQAPKPVKRRRRRTVKTTISEGELERIEQLVADIPAPDFVMPPLSPREPMEYEELPYSPPFKYIAERAGSPIAGEEIPEDIAGYASPRTPPRIPSPGLDVLDVEEYGPGISDVSPPGEYMYESPPPSPVYATPPPGPSEYPAYESPTTPVSPPEAFQRRVREHEYTQQAGDERKAYMTKTVQIKSKRVPVSKLKAKRPRLPLVFESEEPPPSPPPRTPPQVREETLLAISPYDAKERRALESLRDVQDRIAAQYAALYSPEPQDEYLQGIEEIQPEQYDTDIMDAPIGWQHVEALPSALADRQLDFVSPPRTRLPPPMPKRYVPDYGPLPLVDFTSPPEAYTSPPREFEEYFKDVSFEGADVMETSPVYMPPSPGTPPSPTREFEERFKDTDFEDLLETSPVYMPPSPPPRTPPTPRSPIDSPTWLKSIQEHKLVPPQGMGRVRSGSKLVKLQRKTVAPDLEVVEEMQEETTEMETPHAYRPTTPTQRIPSPTPEELAAYIPPRPAEFAAHISSHISEFPSPPPRTPTRQIPIPGTPRSQRTVQMFEPSGSRPRPPRRDAGIRESPSIITETQEIIYGPEEEGSPILQRTAGHVVRYGPPHPPPRPLSPGPWGPLDFDYEIPEPFGGQTSPEVLDTSDIPLEIYTEEEMEDYTWIS